MLRDLVHLFIQFTHLLRTYYAIEYWINWVAWNTITNTMDKENLWFPLFPFHSPDYSQQKKILDSLLITKICVNVSKNVLEYQDNNWLQSKLRQSGLTHNSVSRLQSTGVYIFQTLYLLTEKPVKASMQILGARRHCYRNAQTHGGILQRHNHELSNISKITTSSNVKQ